MVEMIYSEPIKFINEILTKIGLSHIKPSVKILPSYLMYETNSYGGTCSFNPIIKNYEIELRDNAELSSIVHEVFHIYFSELIHENKYRYSFDELAKKQDLLNKIIGSPMDTIERALCDCFTNYHLSTFEEFYPYLLETYGRGLLMPNEWKLEHYNFYEYLGDYIAYYIHWNFITNNDVNCFETGGNLFYLDSVLSEKAEKEEIEFNIYNLNVLLDQFPKVKNLKDYKFYIKYLEKILNCLDVFDNEEIQDFLKCIIKY